MTGVNRVKLGANDAGKALAIGLAVLFQKGSELLVIIELTLERAPLGLCAVRQFHDIFVVVFKLLSTYVCACFHCSMRIKCTI